MTEGRVLSKETPGGRGNECCLPGEAGKPLRSTGHLDRVGKGEEEGFAGLGNGVGQGLETWKTAAC